MSTAPPTESDLKDLISFLHHSNTQIRQVATNTLAGYSSTSPKLLLPLFKANSFEGLKDLKLLAVRDYAPIQGDALTLLVNLTAYVADSEGAEGEGGVLGFLAGDETFVKDLVGRVVVDGEVLAVGGDGSGNVDLGCGLLANLVKFRRCADLLVGLKRELPRVRKVKVKDDGNGNANGAVEGKGKGVVEVQVSKSERVLDQFMDLCVKGANGRLNPKINYDYLSYVFADLSKLEEGRKYLLERQEYDGVVPITKLTVFTDPETGSLVRRKGISGVLKNVAFEVAQHPYLMREEADGGLGLLPYILLPLAGNEEFDAEDSEGMLDELQLLPPDKERELDDEVIVAYLGTLLLLTTSREGRDVLRRIKVYPVIRELYLKRDAENVGEGCARLVDILMRDEEGEQKVKVVDDDHKIEEIF